MGAANTYSAARIAVDFKLFETAVSDNGRSKTNEQRTAATGASLALVERITRTCASMDMPDESVGSMLSQNILAQPQYAANIIFVSTPPRILCADASLPQEYQSPEPREPRESSRWVISVRQQAQRSHRYLISRAPRGLCGVPRLCISCVPIAQPEPRLHSKRAASEGLRTDGDASALVGVRGVIDQALQDFNEVIPEYMGRLVLQQLSEVISAATVMGVGKNKYI